MTKRMHRRMHRRMQALACGWLAATALIAPQAAIAGPRTGIEARLDRLEAELGTLKASLQAARAETLAANQRAADAEARARAAEVQSTAATQQLAQWQARPAPPPPPAAAAPADGFRAGSTTVKLGGYVKLLATSTRFSDGELPNNALGRDFYLPQQVPVGTAPATRTTDFTAKQSRFWISGNTDVAGHAVKGHLEFDFQVAQGTQGTQRTTNGYNLGLRRVYAQIDRWTVGEDWSTFQYTGALPESTDYVGGAEGTVFVRQPLIRYSAPLSKATTLHLSIENPESGTAVLGAPALVENGDDRLPDLAARLVHAGPMAELSLAGLVRQVRTDTAGVRATTGGYGASVGGKLFLNAAKSGDVRFMVTYGHNIGRYIGLNFAPDAVYVPATNRLADVDVLAAIGAVRIPLGPRLRANVMGSYQHVGYDDSLPAAGIAGFNRSVWSAAANLFYSPVSNVDFGVEYRHGVRTLVNGASGTTDRLEGAVKYSF